jgi:rhamnosyltransferase subunit B
MAMAQIVITAIGSAGDVHPLLGVGRVLLQRGHRVVFCTHPQFDDLVMRERFDFVPVGTREAYAEAVASTPLWDRRTAMQTLWNFLVPSIKPHFEKLRDLATPDTVLVGALWSFSARIMQEVHGTPYVSVQIAPTTLLSAHTPPPHLPIPMILPLPARKLLLHLIERRFIDRILGPALNKIRSQHGLPPAHRILSSWRHSPDGVLCLFPEWFAAPQPDWPKNHFLAGFPLFNDIAEGSIEDGALQSFLKDGRPPVVFTPGSTRTDPGQYLSTVRQIVGISGDRGIVLLPRVETTVVEKDMFVSRFIPLQKLLPQCAAIVHHGGIGTAALTFEAGIPQVVMPSVFDQIDNGRRVQRSGCGISLGNPAEPEAIGVALQQIGRDDTIAKRCREVRTLIEQAPDASLTAAKFIEGFARC